MSLNLVYDRTQEDVTSSAAIRSAYQKLGNWSGLTGAERVQLERGTLTYNTLNRVESAVKTLAATLTSAGYPVEVEPVLKGSSRLPSGYTEVEYIAASGTQYVDSGVAETADTAVDCKFDIDTVASDYLFGTRQNSSNLSYNGIYKNNMLEYNYNEISFTAASSIELNEEVTGTTNNITINGVSHTATTGTGTGETMLIFAIRYQTGYNNGRVRPYGGATKLRYFKIKQNGALVRDYIPCKNPDGVVGLYDTIGGQFYTTPLAEEPVELPSGYTQVAYLQSSGTQWIDTGFKPNQDTRFVADVMVTGTSLAYMYGARGTQSENYNPRQGAMFNNTLFRSDYGNGMGVTFSSALTTGNRYTVDQDKNVCTIDSESVTNTALTFQSKYTAYLFGINEGNSAKYICTMRAYSFRIYDNGELVRRMIPARNSAGTLGMYDVIGKTFYTNKGSGTFTAGADIVGFSSGAEIDPYENREWEEGDILFRPQWEIYLSNVQKLRDAYYTLAGTGELPAPGDKLGFEGANNIEKILADIDLLIDCMKSSYRRCGTFRAGANTVHLPLKGA